MNTNDAKHLWSTRIRYIMALRQWTQADLAELLGVSQQMVSKWVRKEDLPSQLRQAELSGIEDKLREGR